MIRLEFDSINSTNSYALTHFSEFSGGELVVAYAQTGGRGRQNRVWHSPAGLNIYASWVLKNVENPGWMAGLAVLEMLRELAPGKDFFLKWPNDVYIRDAKIAGILCEGAEIRNGKVTGAVAGMGININMPESELAKIDQKATSLLVESAVEWDLRKKVLPVLEKTLERIYITYSKDPGRLFGDWKKANALIGRPVTLLRPDGEILEGVFADIDPDGALILERNGEHIRFDCGDVKIKDGIFNP